ncbi:TIGR00300 family protein, partial [Candidatus Bathyarchaeota archaeon]|nr:TIGR00300 family protein [Candidatus Bathyarchaeota archaeon]
MILSKILDGIMDQQGEFEFLEFNVGRKKHDYSSTKIQITGKTREHLDNILGEVLRLGATLPETPEVEYQP